MKQLIQNARLICPAQKLDQILDVAIADGFIAGYGTPGEGVADFTPDEVIAGSGHWLLPGLVDIATQLGEPGDTFAGTIETESRAAVKGGVTTIVCQPNTQPTIDEPSVVEWIERQAQRAGAARVHALAALTHGNEGQHLSEMGALELAGCVGVTNAGVAIKDSLVLRRAMQYAASYRLPILMSPFDAYLDAPSGAHEGELTTRMGLQPISVAAETSALLRDMAIADDLGLPLHVGRLSSQASVEWIAAAKAQHKMVTADTAIHHLLLSDLETEGFAVDAHVRPPLRSHSDRQALVNALKNGVIDIITSDHRPLSADRKDGPFGETTPGISGLESLLSLVLTLIEQNDLPLLDTLATITHNPAKLLGLTAGSLEIGQPADMVMYEADRPCDIVVSEFISAGKNSPFDQWMVNGQVSKTWVKGRLVYAV